MAKNAHKVPKRQWKKWGKAGQAAFNNVYSMIKGCGPAGFLHPETVSRKLSKDEFKTICWNAAWLAADSAKYQTDG